jgi:hypothetical protein
MTETKDPESAAPAEVGPASDSRPSQATPAPRKAGGGGASFWTFLFERQRPLRINSPGRRIEAQGLEGRLAQGPIGLDFQVADQIGGPGAPHSVEVDQRPVFVEDDQLRREGD